MIADFNQPRPFWVFSAKALRETFESGLLTRHELEVLREECTHRNKASVRQLAQEIDAALAKMPC